MVAFQDLDISLGPWIFIFEYSEHSCFWNVFINFDGAEVKFITIFNLNLSAFWNLLSDLFIRNVIFGDSLISKFLFSKADFTFSVESVADISSCWTNFFLDKVFNSLYLGWRLLSSEVSGYLFLWDMLREWMELSNIRHSLAKQRLLGGFLLLGWVVLLFLGITWLIFFWSLELGFFYLIDELLDIFILSVSLFLLLKTTQQEIAQSCSSWRVLVYKIKSILTSKAFNLAWRFASFVGLLKEHG